MAKLTSSQETKLRDAFNLFDSDKSGQLSKKELKNVFTALNMKLNDKELQSLLEQMDINGSGDIDFNEFKTVMAKSFLYRDTRKELEATFKKYDSDGNGFLTMNELQNVMSSMGRHMSRNEIRSMIASLDSNKDGKISFDEFIKLFS